jgi:hypothetical protein
MNLTASHGIIKGKDSTGRKVACSIPDKVSGISDHLMLTTIVWLLVLVGLYQKSIPGMKMVSSGKLRRVAL